LAKKNEHHSLKETKGYFNVRGKLTKVGEDKFFNIKPAGFEGREKGYAGCTMAIKTSDDNVVYNIKVSGNEQDFVKYGTLVDGERNTYDISWADRYDKATIEATCGKDVEANLYGARTVGFERQTYKDKNTGEEKQALVKKKLTGYDAVMEIKKAVDSGKLTDETSVYISGNVKMNVWTMTDAETGERRPVKSIELELTSIGLTANPIDFGTQTPEEARDAASFNMDIVVKEFNEYDGVTYMTGILVGYDCVEEMDFKFSNEQYAASFKGIMEEHLKKGVYPKIRCRGEIKREYVEEEVEIEVDPLDPEGVCKKVRKGPATTSWIIRGAEGSTLDIESYTPENVATAKEACKAYLIDHQKGKSATELKDEIPVKQDLSVLEGETIKSENMDDFKDDELWD